jgi:hypothetical protein
MRMRISSRCSVCRKPSWCSREVAIGTKASILNAMWSTPAWTNAEAKSLIAAHKIHKRDLLVDFYSCTLCKHVLLNMQML